MALLLFLAVLVVLIVVHELGHFFVAKFFGVRVEEFGVGYPPRAFIFGKKGDTTYTLNWLPFGGFVKIFGEVKSVVDKSERKYAFAFKSKWKQVLILIAGVVGNVLLAWILFSSTLMMGTLVAVDENTEDISGSKLIIQSVFPGSPAEAAGFVNGDVILKVQTEDNKKTLEKITPTGVSEFVSEHGGDKLSVTYVHEDIEKVTTVTPSHNILNNEPGRPAVGVALSLITERKYGFIDAMVGGAKKTWYGLGMISVGLVSFFGQALTGGADWETVTGPIGIAGLLGDASALGLVHLLTFTAFISLNLAVINLIPIPALDGGRALFVLVEAVTRRDIPEGFATALNVIGFGAIILLMVIVTYHDIARLFV